MFNLPVSTTPAALRICLSDPAVVSAWCADMQCTEYQLRCAVYAVGSQPYWIRQFFRPSVAI
jgi:hypothetical protein